MRIVAFSLHRRRMPQKGVDAVLVGLHVALAKLDQRAHVVDLEHEKAEDVRARRSTRAQAPCEVSEGSRELRLEFAREFSQVPRWTKHEDLDESHSLTIVWRQFVDQPVHALEAHDVFVDEV